MLVTFALVKLCYLGYKFMHPPLSYLLYDIFNRKCLELLVTYANISTTYPKKLYRSFLFVITYKNDIEEY